MRIRGCNIIHALDYCDDLPPESKKRIAEIIRECCVCKEKQCEVLK